MFTFWSFTEEFASLRTGFKAAEIFFKNEVTNYLLG